jgi:hypothetical protein
MKMQGLEISISSKKLPIAKSHFDEELTKNHPPFIFAG